MRSYPEPLLRSAFQDSVRNRNELSSDPERFLVNFHTNKATQRTATPATHMPMIMEAVTGREAEGSEAAVDVVLGVTILIEVLVELEVELPVRVTPRVEVLVIIPIIIVLISVPLIVDRLAVAKGDLEAELVEEVVLVELWSLLVVVGGRGDTSLWAATKCEQRRGRKTDDHFMFVGEGDRRFKRVGVRELRVVENICAPISLVGTLHSVSLMAYRSISLAEAHQAICY
jgi:hypothetical protein